MSTRFRIFSQGEILEDRYKIVRELSRGGMSIVYLSTDLETGKSVALKQPKPDFEERQNIYCDTIRHEANILSRLDHPNIVKYLGFLSTHNILVEEFIDGNSLSELYSGDRADDKDALNIAIKLCEVLIHMHRNGVVHRDICPKNVIMDSNGTLHVIDFGTALDINQGDCLGAGVHHGPYSCPEMSDRNSPEEPAKLHAADTYSFGATLYSVLSTSPPPSLSGNMICLNPRGSSILNNIVARSTNRDPYLRDNPENILAILRETEAMMTYKPIVRVVKSNDPGVKADTLFFLDKATATIGMGSKCEIDLQAKYITSSHARIQSKGMGWFISDANSMNGTFLNGVKLEPGRPAPLRHGDRIWLVYNPHKSKDPYIQMEFISDRGAVEGYHNELNNLEINTSWNWDGPRLGMTITVKNNSKQQWNNILVNFSSLKDFFRADEDLDLSFDLKPGNDRFYTRSLEFLDPSMGGDFTFPMQIYVGTRLIRDESIHMRYGESFRPSTGLEITTHKRADHDKLLVQLKLRNISPYTYTRVNVGLDMPPGLELVEPDSPSVTIPVLASNEEQLVNYKMKPLAKIKATVHADVSYFDHLGSRKNAAVQGIDTGEIFPFMEPLEMTDPDFAAATERLLSSSMKTMFKGIGMPKARKRVCSACENLYKAGEQKEKGCTQLMFSGRQVKTGMQLLFICSIHEKEDDVLELRFHAYAGQQESAEEFLHEQVDSISRAMRAENALHVTTYTSITDSVVYKPKFSGEMNLKDSMAYKTGQ